MKVLKFGGTSVGSAESIQAVIKIVADNSKQNEKQFIVVSAFSGITDMLLDGIQHAASRVYKPQEIVHSIQQKCDLIISTLLPDVNARIKSMKYLAEMYQELEQLYTGLALIQELTPKTSARIMSFGELVSSYVIAEAMCLAGLNVRHADPRNLIVANDEYCKATVDYEATQLQISRLLEDVAADVILTGGFVARNNQGETTVLGRGGSDYSAAIIASALDANELQIWTDVSGMYSANPKIVTNAKAINEISYREAMELSHFGAKVLYPPTIQPVLDKQIPIRIKNTFSASDAGTLITEGGHDMNPVKGISHVENIALVTLEGAGMVGVTGVSKRLFEALSQAKINVKFITQASSECSICVGIESADASSAKQSVDRTFEFEISRGKIQALKIEQDLSIVACVGDNMKNHQGLSGKMFSTLGKNNINVRAIAQGASENNISAVINTKDIHKALNSLHEAFFEDDLKPIHMYLTGVGNVGKKLIEQIRTQQDYLREHLSLDLKIVGLSNSRKMLFNAEGISLDNWEAELDAAPEKASLNGFLQRNIELNLRNSVFVDITANADVADMYADYLKHSIAVIACNKIAAANQYSKYKALKTLSKKYNVSFLFETNVGAGLPIIATLNNLVASGDKVRSIHAVLSGSLNFICNHFNSDVSFHDIVQQAQADGYTEPDPRIDLSGVDVARKILILARESGLKLELEDIENKSFLTEKNHAADTVEDFYESLKTEEAYFLSLYTEASKKGCRLKYVATLEAGKASVGLQEIPAEHPFYDLQGKDNIVMYYTDRYREQPLIVKGAGAGADVTAAGVFADVIRVANV